MNKKKGVMINLDSNVIQILKHLAEKNSSSMSQEVRRLILEENNRTKTGFSNSLDESNQHNTEGC